MRTAHLLLVTVASSLAVMAPVQAAPAGDAGPVETNLTATTFDLGTLGGASSEATAVDGTIVVGTSDTASDGLVVRSTDTAPDDRRAFAYDLAAAEPTMTDLGTLGGKESWATAVEGTIVVGHSRTTSGETHAFAYDLTATEPAMTDLGTLGGTESWATAVDGTLVVGWSQTAASGPWHAFAYDLAAAEPAMTDLGTLGGSSSAVDVDGTIVVGYSLTTASGPWHAFAYDLAAADPVMQDLGTLGGDYSEAADVDGTIVVGYSLTTASGRSRAFAYDLAAADPAMQDLGTLGGRSDATAVDGTTVVGSSFAAAPRRQRAFAYDLAAPEPTMRDLGTVRGGESTSTSATAIDGDIVIGRWRSPGRGWLNYPPFSSFAYDLGAAAPTMLGLGSWQGALASDVDGDVVVGSSYKGPTRHATAWVLSETTRPMIAFRRLERGVKEDAGQVTIKVTLSGRIDRAVTVRYRTRSNTARAGKDFVATSGTLRFAPGVTRRTITVKILNDRRRETKEHLLLTLSRPGSPALLGTPKWSQLRIEANDR